MTPPRPIAGLVLTGGRSRRMGQDKAWLDWQGKPLLRHIIEQLAPRLDPLVVVAAAGQSLPQLPNGVSIQRDPEPFQGPLVAISHSLETVPQNLPIFLTGCDYPGVGAAAVDFLAERLEGHDAVVPRIGGQAHPLFALYQIPLSPVIQAILDCGRRDFHALLEVLNVRCVEAEEWTLLDPAGHMLRNLNTPEDYGQARLTSSRP
jgi:molybdenum cofactor guanylyltransferase